MAVADQHDNFAEPAHDSSDQAPDDGKKGIASDHEAQQTPVTASGSRSSSEGADTRARTFTVPYRNVDHTKIILPKPKSKTPITPTEASTMPVTHVLIGTEVDVRRYIMENIKHGGDAFAFCFFHATTQPPINPGSLTELDMARIINNPKLHADVNFDRELHFRPNLDGSKGAEKIKLANDYWMALEGEFTMYRVAQVHLQATTKPRDEAYWEEVLGVSAKRLPKIFDAVREILKTLVPDRDQKVVARRLDTTLLMQQIKHGVCDLVGLADWLDQICQAHCAPMRDTTVAAMAAQIKHAVTENSSYGLVEGIRQLLVVLEMMKLDVANHQIRYMRNVLVEDTILFGKAYNAHRITIKKVDVIRARLWLEREATRTQQHLEYPNWLEALTSGTLRSILFVNPKNEHPNTFYLDTDRLAMIRGEFHTTVYHNLCIEILREMVKHHGPPQSVLANAVQELGRTVNAIIGTSGNFDEHLDNVAVEIMRLVLAMEGGMHQFDQRLLEHVELRLFEDCRPDSQIFKKHAQHIFNTIIPKLRDSVAEHYMMPPLRLQEILVPPPPIPMSRGFGVTLRPAPAPVEEDYDMTVVRKLTHIIVLHWQVWAPLAYLAPEYEDDAIAKNGIPPYPDSPPAMVPVVEAVYAPGRKWLPIGVRIIHVPPQPLTASIPSSPVAHAVTADMQVPTPDPSPDSSTCGDSADDDDSKSDAQGAFDSKGQQQRT